MRESRTSGAFRKLLVVAERLKFQPHRISHLLDEKGRHDLKLPESFPFMVSLFHLRAGAITQHLTWHQRLELLVPLDGPLRERMGDLVVDLQPGDVLVEGPSASGGPTSRQSSRNARTGACRDDEPVSNHAYQTVSNQGSALEWSRFLPDRVHRPCGVRRGGDGSPSLYAYRRAIIKVK